MGKLDGMIDEKNAHEIVVEHWKVDSDRLPSSIDEIFAAKRIILAPMKV